jgi:lipopolysaccharide transport system permease protein
MKSATMIINSRDPSRFSPLKEMWQYRELLHFLAVRDIKVRYRQTVLGGLWALLQPLLAMVLFSAVFGRLAQLPSDGLPYPLFVYAALLAWQFFSGGISSAGNSLIASSHLISKIYFPRIMIPLATLEVGIVDFLVAFGLLVAMMAWYGVAPGWGLLALPLVLGGVFLATLGVGLLLSALCVVYRDFRHVLPFLTQFWLFATPVIYPTSLVPEGWRWVINLNPMAGLVTAFRACLFDQPIPWADLALSLTVATGLLVIAVRYFLRVERRFADII